MRHTTLIETTSTGKCINIILEAFKNENYETMWCLGVVVALQIAVSEMGSHNGKVSRQWGEWPSRLRHCNYNQKVPS